MKKRSHGDGVEDIENILDDSSKSISEDTSHKSMSMKKRWGIVATLSLVVLMLMGVLIKLAVPDIVRDAQWFGKRLSSPNSDIAQPLASLPKDSTAGQWLENKKSKSPRVEFSGGSPVMKEGSCSSSRGRDETFLDGYRMVETDPSSLSEFVTYEVYATGTAGRAFDNYRDSLDDCVASGGKGSNFTVKKTKDGARYMVSNGTVAAVVGDVVVSWEAIDADEGRARGMVEKVSKELKEFGPHQCQAIAVDADRDFNRNQLAAKDKFTGVTETFNQSYTVDPHHYGTPVETTVKDLPKNLPTSAPEGPLPFGIDSEMPSKPIDKPAEKYRDIPRDDAKQNVSAQYQVIDKTGPGCGWEWSQFPRPDLDEKEVRSHQDGEISRAKDNLKKRVVGVRDRYAQWSRDSVGYYENVRTWNEYVDKSVEVSRKWSDFESSRAAFKPKWDKYVKEHDNWLTFEDRYRQANQEYRQAYEKCLESDRLYRDRMYHSRHGSSPSRSSSPSVSPSVKAEAKKCDTKDVKRPSILDGSKPIDEPKKPEVPQGVTIPDSWKKPLTSSPYASTEPDEQPSPSPSM